MRRFHPDLVHGSMDLLVCDSRAKVRSSTQILWVGNKIYSTTFDVWGSRQWACLVKFASGSEREMRRNELHKVTNLCLSWWFLIQIGVLAPSRPCLFYTSLRPQKVFLVDARAYFLVWCVNKTSILWEFRIFNRKTEPSKNINCSNCHVFLTIDRGF